MKKFKALVKLAVDEHIDPWADKHIESLPAEKVTRHRYIPETQSWVTDTSIIKMEPQPFDRGAQRQVYRLKKISQAPTSKWHQLDWSKAPNYVAKSYLTDDGNINTTNRRRCFDDVRLQYEAAYWANIFNSANPPKNIMVIQCYVLELSSRPNSPVVGCERYVDGHDKCGAGFVKHNSNSGYVDTAERRATPQAFSAHSFYASAGRTMVVDIQGVGDLYTDPQIHSQDTRFGDSDLGVRGMALFFVSFRRNPVCDLLKLPRFPLSSNERDRMLTPKSPRAEQLNAAALTGVRKDFFRRESLEQYMGVRSDTITRSKALEAERKIKSQPSFTSLSRSEQLSVLPASLTHSEQQDIDSSLELAESYAVRVVSAGEGISEELIFTEINPAVVAADGSPVLIQQMQSVVNNTMCGTVENPIHDVEEWRKRVLLLQRNTAEVHLELALLEANGRFTSDDSPNVGMGMKAAVIGSPFGDPVADISSCIVHLCHATILGSCAAALSLGRLRFGVNTDILAALSDYVPIDTNAALSLLQLAAYRGSIVGACLAGNICRDNGDLQHAVIMYQLAIENMSKADDTKDPYTKDTEAGDVSSASFCTGDHVEANYYGCGSWYTAVVTKIIAGSSSSDKQYGVKYDDGGEEEIVGENCIRFPVLNKTEVEMEPEDYVNESSQEHTLDGTNLSEHDSEKGDGANKSSPYVPRKSVGDDDLPTVADYELLAMLGELYLQLSMSTSVETTELSDKATNCFTSASERAMVAGKPALAMKYLDHIAT